MRIGNYNVSLGRTDLAQKKATKKGSAKKATGKVDVYSEVATKTFGQYKTSAGNVSIDFDIVEGLYRRTIMRKVVDKMAGDAVRLGYTVIYTDFEGNPHEEASAIGADIDRIIKRKTMKNVYRDRDVYGDAFLYKQIGTSETGLSNVQDLYGISPRKITPKEENGQLTGWEFQSSTGAGTVDLSLEEVIHIPRDPLTGVLFGDSIFESVLQVLNLILNSQLNTAIILDRFAIPLVHWLIDAKHERRKTPLTEIKSFIQRLSKMQVGADLVTDSSITHEVVGKDSKMIDFSPMLDKLDSYFFATAGIPGQIMGMPADNLSAITRQMQTYYENIFDMQGSVADCLIYDLYWPEMVNAGIDDLARIDIVYNKPMIEQESRIITWVQSALALDLIDREQARRILGLQGPPPTVSNDLEWILGNNNAFGQDPEFDKKQKQEKPSGTNPKKGSQSGSGGS